MNYLSKECRSIILASGSLAPLPALCNELGLLSSETDAVSLPSSSVPPSKETLDRLQMRPPPLEASHVISLNDQLLAVGIGHFPCGSPLTVTFSKYNKNDDFLCKLGDAIATVVESIPRGGVLVFLSSYSLLKRCIKLWRDNAGWSEMSVKCDVWDRLVSNKGKVIVEPTGSQVDFEAKREEYQDTIRRTGTCVLFAVFRGKMSEGISFNDENARGVICVGIPYPSSFDRSVKAKKSYNNEQRKLAGKTAMLSGDAWYSQQAYRALAQALGRCIRHAGDYGTVILMDSRFCDESPPNSEGTSYAHQQLPKWMRSHVKSLSMNSAPDPYNKLLHGSWKGLKKQMGDFFEKAPDAVAEILRKQQESLA